MTTIDNKPLLSTGDVAALRRQIRGNITLPGDEPYDQLRTPWMQVVEQHPALIINAAGAKDVTVAVTFAREHR